MTMMKEGGRGGGDDPGPPGPTLVVNILRYGS